MQLARPCAFPIVVLSVLVGSCASCDEQRPDGLPEETVRELFDAVEARECEEIRTMLGGRIARDFDEIGCDEALEVLGAQTVVRIEPSKVDGRDPKLRLVPVSFEGIGQPSIVHVRAEDGMWKVVSL